MRRRIWEIGCTGIDAVLVCSFDPDELRAIDPHMRSAEAIPTCPGLAISQDHLAFAIAHRACHCENPLSRKIEKRLSAMHAPVIKAFEKADPADVLAACYAAGASPEGDVAGCMWAVLTDPRPELRQQDTFWVQGVTLRALRHWLDGRRACPAERDAP